jgi:rhodanese-related sulfurtransferase
VVSPQAVRLLRERGFDAGALEGGLTGWRRAGHRLA